MFFLLLKNVVSERLCFEISFAVPSVICWTDSTELSRRNQRIKILFLIYSSTRKLSFCTWRLTRNAQGKTPILHVVWETKKSTKPQSEETTYDCGYFTFLAHTTSCPSMCPLQKIHQSYFVVSLRDCFRSCTILSLASSRVYLTADPAKQQYLYNIKSTRTKEEIQLVVL